MEAVVSTLRTFNTRSSFECVIFLVILLSRTLNFIICGPEPKIYLS